MLKKEGLIVAKSQSVRGIVRNSIVELLDNLPCPNGTEVKVTILGKKSEKIWDKIKLSLAEKYPDLPKMTHAEANLEFEQLSDKVAKNMEFKDWREMERFMKGDKYGLTGH